MQSMRELLAKSFPQQPYLIGEGLLNERSLMFIGAPPKSYKSFLLNTMCINLATGTPLFSATRKNHGRDVIAFPIKRPTRVLLLEQEIGDYDLKERIEPVIRSLSPDERELALSNIYTQSCDFNLRLDTKEGMEQIETLVSQAKPEVVCFDPFFEFHSADENAAHAMSLVLRNLSILRQRFGVSLIITHHTGKPREANDRSGPDLLRGSSAIYGKGDAYLMMEVRNAPAGIIRIVPTIRRGRPIRAFYIMLDWSDLRAKFYRWSSRKTDKEILTIKGTEDGEEYEN